MKSDTINIYKYNNFRRYLFDYLEARVRIDKKFNKSTICKKLGIPNSRSYVNDVINGKKVTPAYIERFISALELDRDESQFFRVLVKMNQADNSDEHELYFRQLIALNKTPKRLLDKNAYEFFGNWEHSTVRTMLDIVDCKDNYSLLADSIHLPITKKQIQASIKLLKKLELIAPDAHGNLKPSDKAVTTGEWGYDDLIKQYQSQWLDLAQKSVIKQSRLHQKFATNLLSISPKGYERLQERITQFFAEVRSLVNKDEDTADRVYFMALQLFPVGSSIQRKKDEIL
jgi:uncharacterized protein (TIGR02147 family)